MPGAVVTQFEVLIVDDEPGDIELTRMALMDGKYNCHVTTASNGDEALSMLRQEGAYASVPKPDLVLLDLNMPQKSGKEVLKEMKAAPDLAAIPAAKPGSR